MKNNNDIGQAFNKAFDEFKIEPNADMWAKINTQNIAAGNVSRFTLFTKMAASIVLIASIATIAFFINSEKEVVAKELPIKTEEVNKVPVKIVENQVSEKKVIIENKAETTEGEVTNSTVTDNKTANVTEIVKYEIPIISRGICDGSERDEEIVAKPIITDIKLDVVGNNNEIDSQISSSSIKNNINEIGEVENITNADSFIVKFGADKTVCFGEDAILEIEEGYQYYWNSGDVGNKLLVKATENSVYKVTVTNGKGQTITHAFKVNIDRSCSALFIPSAFTPNADGQNDVFKAEGIGIVNMKMFVYDKNGNKVFETYNIDNSWSGDYRGKQLQGGMFFYHAEYTDAMGKFHVKKGQITLIR